MAPDLFKRSFLLMKGLGIILGLSCINTAYSIDWLWPIKKINLILRNQELLEATQEGNTRRVEELLTIPNIDVNYHNHNDYTLLMYAAWEGHREIVKMLIAHHAQVDNQNKNGYTALMHAVLNDGSNSIDIIKMLIAAQANIDLKTTPHGLTALFLAKNECGNHEIVALLEQAVARKNKEIEENEIMIKPACSS